MQRHSSNGRAVPSAELFGARVPKEGGESTYDKRRAFTLLEVIVVLVLLGIVGAVIVPAILQAARPNPAATAAAPFVTVLRSAQKVAASRDVPVRVVLDPATAEYLVTTPNDTAPIRAGVLSLPLSAHLYADSTRVRFVFHPTGGADADSLIVSDGAKSVVIRIDPWTGAINVVPR